MSLPNFVIFTGPMFGSKTTKLLSAIERYNIQGKTVIAFKPSIDIRYSETEIVSHLGAKITANVVATAQDVAQILNKLNNRYDVIAVDEAFMIKDIAEILIEQFRKGKTILVTSLDLYHIPQVFEETAKILPWATKIVKCSAVCAHKNCNRDAYYTFKKKNNGQDLEVGGSELYEPRCWYHHPQIKLT